MIEEYGIWLQPSEKVKSEISRGNFNTVYDQVFLKTQSEFFEPVYWQIERKIRVCYFHFDKGLK